MSINQPTAKDIQMMKLAIEEARQAIANGKAGVGALLLWHDEILAIGHNMYYETGDMTAHGEMAVLRDATPRLRQMSDKEKEEITIYSTLEPCLMCACAISFVGIRRVVYSALTEDINEEQVIIRGITIDTINPLFSRGPLELIPSVLREEGKELLALMGKTPTIHATDNNPL